MSCRRIILRENACSLRRMPTCSMSTKARKSSVPLTQKCMVLGSAKDINGQILDTTSPTVNRQHAALLYMKGKMYFKPINGGATVHYVGDFPYLKGTKLTCANPAKVVLSGTDSAKALTKQKCAFRLGESTRVYYLDGSLPVGKEDPTAATERRDDRDRRDRDDRRRDERRDRDRRDRDDRDDR